MLNCLILHGVIDVIVIARTGEVHFAEIDVHNCTCLSSVAYQRQQRLTRQWRGSNNITAYYVQRAVTTDSRVHHAQTRGTATNS